MSGAGWAFLVLIWGAIIGVTGWCFSKLLSSPEPKNPDPGGAHRL